MYRVQIVNSSGTLVRDLIPCYRVSDNVTGMYDLVNDVFYANSGSGSFVCGSAVSAVTYSAGKPLDSGPNTIKSPS